MKTIKFLFVALVALISITLTSCEKTIIVNDTLTSELLLNIGKSNIDTKALTVTENIESVTLISFYADGTVSSVQEYDLKSITDNKLRCSVRLDVKKLLLITNAPTGAYKVNTLEEALNVKLPLNNTMTSEIKDVTLVSGLNVVDMTMTRLFSKVVLSKLELDIRHRASFKPTAVYLYNANTFSRIRMENPSETVWANGTTQGFLYKTFNTLTEQYDFICYNNPTAKPTKLVIEGSWTQDGKTSKVYYPIYMKGNSVNRNTLYNIEARIKAKGVTAQNVDIDMSSIAINMNVAAYDESNQYSEM